MSKRLVLSVALAATLLMTPLMRAQAAAPAQTAPPPVPYGTPVDLDTAKKVAAVAIAEARRQGLFMAFAVVDWSGNLVYFERADNTQIASGEIAIAKARSAAQFRRPTKFFQDAVAAGGEGLRMLGLAGAVPVEGGIPLVQGGKIIGAIGVSGGTSEQDSQCAQAGASSLK